MIPEEEAAQKAADDKKAEEDRLAADKAAEDAKNAKPKIFDEDDVNRIIQKRLDQERDRNEAKAAKEKEAAEQARLKEQGEFKILNEQNEARVRELEAQIASEKLSNLRMKVATEAKLPQIFWNRIQGETEADMLSDALELAKNVAPPVPPKEEGAGGKRGPSGVIPKPNDSAALAGQSEFVRSSF